MNQDTFEISLVCWLVAQALIIPWMYKAAPDKKLLEKYSKSLIRKSSFPFGKKWRTGVAQEDIVVFEKHQNRIKIWYLSVIIPYALFYLLEYFRV